MRTLDATNETAVAASHIHEVTLVHFAFDTPVYAHSGIGTISYGGNDYLGVGQFGSVSPAKESEQLGPGSVTFTLDGRDAALVVEALDAGNYYDAVTVYVGFRQDDGTLIADPEKVWSGYFESASITVGDQSRIAVVCQHDLAVLEERAGGRYSDEDQQLAYASDVGLEYLADQVTVKLRWGAHSVVGTGGGGGGGTGDHILPK